MTPTPYMRLWVYDSRKTPVLVDVPRRPDASMRDINTIKLVARFAPHYEGTRDYFCDLTDTPDSRYPEAETVCQIGQFTTRYDEMFTATITMHITHRDSV